MPSFQQKIIPLGKQLKTMISILPTRTDLKTEFPQDQKYTSSTWVTVECQAHSAHIRTSPRLSEEFSSFSVFLWM